MAFFSCQDLSREIWGMTAPDREARNGQVTPEWLAIGCLQRIAAPLENLAVLPDPKRQRLSREEEHAGRCRRVRIEAQAAFRDRLRAALPPFARTPSEKRSVRYDLGDRLFGALLDEELRTFDGTDAGELEAHLRAARRLAALDPLDFPADKFLMTDGRRAHLGALLARARNAAGKGE